MVLALDIIEDYFDILIYYIYLLYSRILYDMAASQNDLIWITRRFPRAIHTSIYIRDPYPRYTP